MTDAVDADLDTLYGVRPEDFTALRKELSGAAKKRGDAEAATEIAAARRPTTAAWVMNRLVRADPGARSRLAAVGEGLRAAHADMDGARIRELTAAQRALVHELVRAAFAAADLADPAAALRDEVTDTLQAAIADPEVAARLGRLAKAERYSGFGGFGPSDSTPAPRAPDEPARSAVRAGPTGPSEAERRAATTRVKVAAREAETARTVHDRAAAEVTERRTAVATARRHYQRRLEQLSEAEHALDGATAALDAARDAESGAAERAAATEAARAEAEAVLAELDSPSGRLSGR